MSADLLDEPGSVQEEFERFTGEAQRRRRDAIEGCSRLLWMRTSMSVFDLWLEEPPGNPPRPPDKTEPNAEAAARRLLEYQTRVRAD